MSSIFISHSSQDNAVATQLKQTLETWGHQSIFLDFDPDAGIAAGTNWEKILYARLRACQAVVVLCSPASMASKWVFAEITHIRSLGKLIFPVKVTACEPLSLLKDTQFFDLLSDPECHGLRRGLQAAGLEDVFLWDGKRPPYPGLTAFQEADAALFFGRTEEIRKGVEQLRRLRHSGQERLLLYLGASGSGKSSLVRAGIVPRLKQDSERWIVLEPLRPNEGLGDPFETLSVILSEAFQQYAQPRSPAEIKQQLMAIPQPSSQKTPNELPGLIRVVYDLAIAAQRRAATVLLVIDQFEELLGSATSGAAQSFLAYLGTSLAAAQSLSACPLLVLVTMRSDFVASFQKAVPMQPIETEQFLVNPISVSHFGELIEAPAQLSGVILQPGLVSKIVADASTANALPLLAFTLSELWLRYGGDGDLTLAEYAALGGLQGSVKARAAEVFERVCVDSVSEKDLRTAFLNMVQLREGDSSELSPYVRKCVKRDVLPPDVIPMLKKFVDARLLVEKQSGTYEVAHEALFQVWPQLKSWLETDYEFLRWRHRLNEALNNWKESGQDHDTLLRGGPLATAEDWESQYSDSLTENEQDYIHQSVALRTRQTQLRKEQAQRKLKDTRKRLMEARLVAFGFLGLLVLATQQMFAAQQQELRALTQTADAKFALDAGSLEALEASLVAGQHLNKSLFGRFISASDRANLLRVVERDINQVMERNRWQGHNNIAETVRYSPDGEVIVTGSYDNTAKLWLLDGREIQSLEGHSRAVMAADFSRDGRLLATASLDGSVRLWQRDQSPTASPDDLPSFNPLPDSLTSEDRLSSLDLSDDGQRLITGSLEGTVKLWQRQGTAWVSTDMLSPSPAQPAAIGAVGFSPDETTIAAAGDEGTVQLWDTAGNPQETYRYDSDLLGLGFSPDGNTLIASAEDGAVVLWNRTLKGDQGITLDAPLGETGHADSVEEVQFSPDGQLIATASLDGTIKLWTSEGKLLKTLVGSRSRINSFDFHPDSGSLSSVSRDGIISVWQVAPAMGTSQSIADNLQDGEAVSFHPQTGIVAFNNENQLQLQPVGQSSDQPSDQTAHNLPPPVVVHEHTDSISGIRFSPTGNLIASSSYDHTVMISQLDTPAAVSVIQPRAGRVYQSSFSPEADLLATATENGTVQLWNLPEGSRSTGWSAHEGTEIFDITFSPDGTTLLTAGSGGTVKLWRLDGEEIAPLSGHQGTVYEASFSPAGDMIATAGHDKTVRLWNREGDLLKTLEGHKGRVFTVKFSPDNSMIASAGEDATVRLWSRNGVPIAVLSSHREMVNEISFSADSQQVASISNDGSVVIHDLAKSMSLESLIEEGCEWMQAFTQPDNPVRHRICPAMAVNLES